jgi:hypothetical protein
LIASHRNQWEQLKHLPLKPNNIAIQSVVQVIPQWLASYGHLSAIRLLWGDFNQPVWEEQGELLIKRAIIGPGQISQSDLTDIDNNKKVTGPEIRLAARQSLVMKLVNKRPRLSLSLYSCLPYLSPRLFRRLALWLVDILACYPVVFLWAVGRAVAYDQAKVFSQLWEHYYRQHPHYYPPMSLEHQYCLVQLAIM